MKFKYPIRFAAVLFIAICGLINTPVLADPPTMVIIDDGFSNQDDVDIYNINHGTEYVYDSNAFNNIPEAILIPSVCSVMVMPGNYYDPVYIEDTGYRYIQIYCPRDTGDAEIIPEATFPVDTFPGPTQNAGIAVIGDSVCFNNIIFDFHLIKSNYTAGLFYWNSEGHFTHCVFQNMSIDNDHYEVTGYFKAPDFSQEDPAEIYIDSCAFYNTGRLAVITGGWIHATIDSNTFIKDTPDFGYAIEMGSTSSGIIKNNLICGFKREVGDYGSAGIYIENCYTADIIENTVIKDVILDSNDVGFCGMGVVIGNEHADPAVTAGNVHIYVNGKHNYIHHDTTFNPSLAGTGIKIADEGDSSKVVVTLDSNRIEYNDNYSIYMYTRGNGRITANLRYNWIAQNEKGLFVEETAKGGVKTDGIYEFDIHHNVFDNLYDGRCDIGMRYWDDGDSIGNCWYGFDTLHPGYNGWYWVIDGMYPPGAIDRYPNVWCGGCKPGDANKDGMINIIDITYLIEYGYLEGPPPRPVEMGACGGDPNGDDIVNILDISYLIDYLYQGGSPPMDIFFWTLNCLGDSKNSSDVIEEEHDITLPTGRAMPYR